MINILIFILIFNLQFSIFNFQPSIFNLQFSTFNFQSSIFNLQFNKGIPAAITVSGFPVPPRC